MTILNGMPQCPRCIKLTNRTHLGTKTVLQYVDKEMFKDIYVDNTAVVSFYKCDECLNHFTTSGNDFEGYQYLHFAEKLTK